MNDLRAAAPRPTQKATARLLGLLLAFFVLTGLAGALRLWSLATLWDCESGRRAAS